MVPVKNENPAWEVVDDLAEHTQGFYVYVDESGDRVEYSSTIRGKIKSQIKKYISSRNANYFAKHTTAQKKDPNTIAIGPPSQWQQTFQFFLYSVFSGLSSGLSTIREAFSKIFPHKMFPALPKDAFWVVKQVETELKKIIPDWLVDWLGSLLKPVFTWLAQRKWILQAIPIVGLVMNAMIATYHFYYEKNKNLFVTSKFLADIAATVLLGVGIGLMQWGVAAVAIYTAPYLFVAAAAIVATVGLVRTGCHLYELVTDRAHWKQHLNHALGELLYTFINTAGIVLTLIGFQSIQQLAQFSLEKFNFDVLIHAANLYATIAPLTNYVLAAAGALVVTKVVSKVLQWFSKKNDPVVVRNENIDKVVGPLIQQKEVLLTDIDKAAKKDNIIDNTLNQRRQQKIKGLNKFIQHIYENKNTYSKESLQNLEKEVYKECPSIYQSFLHSRGATETVIGDLIDSTPSRNNTQRA